MRLTYIDEEARLRYLSSSSDDNMEDKKESLITGRRKPRKLATMMAYRPISPAKNKDLDTEDEEEEVESVEEEEPEVEKESIEELENEEVEV